MNEVYLECQKCKSVSGDNWSQCNKKCPVKNSPYFDEEILKEFGPLKEVTIYDDNTKLS